MRDNRPAERGMIFDVERFSTADGPGIRTVVFFKGCNFHCFWCHNPESIRPYPELELDEGRCIGCGMCVEICPRRAHRISPEHTIDRKACVRCFQCARVCPPGALKQVGKVMDVDEVMGEVREDAVFYRRSGGGVTLSGGEVLLQPYFAAGILRRCRQEGISTAIESNLSLPRQELEKLLPYLDLVMADIKHMDRGRHRDGTGEDNRQTLDNLLWLNREWDIPMVVRTPVIPGYNDTQENMEETASFLAGLDRLMYYELLSYNPMGSSKRRQLGMGEQNIPVPGREHMDQLAAAARRHLDTVWVDGVAIN